MVPRVINGDFVYPEWISDNNSIKVENGANQLAVNVGQIVFEDGKRRKFDSQPLLLEFDAPKDAELTLTYNKFRTIEEANAFEMDPKLTLKDANGKDVEFSMVQLRKGGLQGFRDYEREVADYNKAMNNISEHVNYDGMSAKAAVQAVTVDAALAKELDQRQVLGKNIQDRLGRLEALGALRVGRLRAGL